MAVALDERARAAVARRRARGNDATVCLRLERLSPRGSGNGGIPYCLTAGWAPRRAPAGGLSGRCVGDIQVYLDERVARYTQRHDVTISSWRLGPIERLVVTDPYAVVDMWK